VNRAATIARTMWEVMLADPIRQGRLRIAGLPPLIRQLAIAGIVVLGGLLVSLVFNDLWRRSDLTLVRDFEPAPNLAARAVIPFTLVSLAGAWALILAGAALARPPVAVVIGVAFLLANSGISDTIVIGEDTTLLRVLPDVVTACYFATPAVAVALSVLRSMGRWRPARVVAAIALAIGVATFFGGQLVIYVIEESEGHLVSLPRGLDGTLNNLQGFLVPLFILAVAGLVQLNHHVAEAVVTPFWDASALVAKLLVLGLIAIKLRYGLVGRTDEWSSYVAERWPQALQGIAYLLFLAGAAWLFRRLRQAGADDATTETLVYGASFLLASAVVLVGLVVNVALFFASRGAQDTARWVSENFPSSFVARYGLIAVFTVVLLVGIVLATRPRRTPHDRAVGGALVLIGAWVVPNVVLQQLSERDVGFDIGFVDLLLTLVALVYLAGRWRRLDTAGAVRVGALLVFASLVAGNGYVATRVVSKVLAFFTPPAVLLIVIGVLYVVLADSSFASVTSANFPRETRVLLWLGYLIFSVAVTNYVLVAREIEYRIEFDRFAFHLLALPLAAWLAVRSRFAPPTPPAPEEP
jgi:hypothetical protein